MHKNGEKIMQVQANDVIDKFAARLSQLMKEGIIMEAQLEIAAKMNDEKDAKIADLTAKLNDAVGKLEQYNKANEDKVANPTT